LIDTLELVGMKKSEANLALERNDYDCHASCGARVAPAIVMAHL
jgi:hypothetical protein